MSHENTLPWVMRGEVAKRLRVTERCVDMMAADGRLTAYRLGPRIIRFRINEVDAALKPVRNGIARSDDVMSPKDRRPVAGADRADSEFATAPG